MPLVGLPDCDCPVMRQMRPRFEPCERCGKPVIYVRHEAQDRPDDVYELEEHRTGFVHELFLRSHVREFCDEHRAQAAAADGGDGRDESLRRLREALRGGRGGQELAGETEEERFPEPTRRGPSRRRPGRR